MEVPSERSNKKRKREPPVDSRITYHTPLKTFERVFQGWFAAFSLRCLERSLIKRVAIIEHSLEDIKHVVRRKLGLADDLDVQLTQIRGNSSIVLEDGNDIPHPLRRL